MAETSTLHTKGLVMHDEARWYDLLAWALTLGRDRAFRDRLVDLARIAPGEVVLDVGCGTGTLAIAAKRRAGGSGRVHGIDASPEMIERATQKAAKQGVDVAFQPAVVEALPFADGQFDVVSSTLMLHHLPRPVRQQCAREMRRVLKPGGRVLAVDFATPANERQGLLARFHRHGQLPVREIVALLGEAGFQVVELGSVGVSDLHFVLATVPLPETHQPNAELPASRSLKPLPAPRWIAPALVVALVAGHALILVVGARHLALSMLTLVAIAGVLAIAHLRASRVLHRFLRRWSAH